MWSKGRRRCGYNHLLQDAKQGWKASELWGAKPSIASELQALQLGNGGETV
jgi:hypothetical protein